MSNNTQDVQQGALTVHVRGFKHSGGHAIAKLYRPGDNVRSKTPWRSEKAPIHGDEALCVFSGLPEGTYAVVAFHDENDNGQIDHAFGRPSEPLGFSNGFVLSLTSGLPTFEKLQFDFNPERGAAATVEVTVR